ncbi:MAG: hypothetical protein CO042_01270 [Parcubacteria group bacterium CG_4_9_14_0_2_um_filter_41_8]|nr:MAG: hypothetical protein COV79_04645 [Parcubacteria group bacterium CG11_big_fil_rev_8_21_14_0_20_41_14]PIZ82427.1 MAG: hypothetical protein COY02_00030 [Parcubacteria group bacterium CG_4_10_14_0_2_um_filter_41_6]PJC40896.1 MAG: hypothetical protein CO042_01270 [Parcubacteria group bacterium CG_4_9_14_0_2_um_filter_41_8]
MFRQKRIENYAYSALISANILIAVLLWFFSIWRFGVSQDFVSLHYTVYFGLDRFGPRHDLFLFPLLGTVILILNLAVARYVLEDSKLWKVILVSLTFLMQACLLSSLILTTLKELS